jgi:hypothetical protein
MYEHYTTCFIHVSSFEATFYSMAQLCKLGLKCAWGENKNLGSLHVNDAADDSTRTDPSDNMADGDWL